MRGIVRHFLTTLLLNCRNVQALVFGYVVPVFFLIAFATVFGDSGHSFKHMGQLLTISALGGACFGLPIAMVSERERGVWRRYRLTPLGSGWFVLSTALARYLLVASSGLLQIVLAMVIYKMPFPAHPLDLLIAFTCAAAAFIGIGLIIASIANSTGSVQALGQSIFLPMIMIGGVGIPMYVLPEWARPISLFLPGRYAVDAINNSLDPKAGVFLEPVCLLALLIIACAAILVGAVLFRWEPGQRLARSAPAWIALAAGSWVAIGAVVLLLHQAPAH